MRRFVIWSAAALLTVLLTVLAFCPAAWLSYALELQTGGRLTLGDAQGTLSRGSAFVGAAPGKNNPVTPLLPGRFSVETFHRCFCLAGSMQTWKIRRPCRKR